MESHEALFFKNLTYIRKECSKCIRIFQLFLLQKWSDILSKERLSLGFQRTTKYCSYLFVCFHNFLSHSSCLVSLIIQSSVFLYMKSFLIRQKQSFTGVLEKKFSKISQNSQENTCVGVLFCKVIGLRSGTIKKRLRVFL